MARAALGLVETAALQRAHDRSRFAERGQADEAREALLAHVLEPVGNAVLAQHVLDADRAEHAAALARADLVVQLEEVDRIAPQPAQTFVHAALDRARNVGELVEVETHLGRQIGRLRDLREQRADRLFRASLTVERRSVDPVDAGIERAAQHPTARVGVGQNHEPADVATAEHHFRDPQPRTAKPPVFHKDCIFN